MRVRVSNQPDGWREVGPGFARSQGYAGTLVVAPSPPRLTRAESALKRLVPRPKPVDALEVRRAKWREWKQRQRDRRAA